MSVGIQQVPILCGSFIVELKTNKLQKTAARILAKEIKKANYGNVNIPLVALATLDFGQPSVCLAFLAWHLARDSLILRRSRSLLSRTLLPFTTGKREECVTRETWKRVCEGGAFLCTYVDFMSAPVLGKFSRLFLDCFYPR